jgi:hypothetical protein
LRDLDVIDVVEEINDAARLKDQSAAEPVLITTNGTILAGFGRWRLAVFVSQNCKEGYRGLPQSTSNCSENEGT